ncbi:MAG: phospholipase D-like domain-containing protein [Pseudomonadota bacterium]
MTDRVDVGALPVPGGYFLVSGPLATVPERHPTSSKEKFLHCATYQGEEHSIRGVVLDLIRRAEKKIFIAAFRIGDEELLAALEEAAVRLQGGVYVITALDPDSLRRGLGEVEDDAEADVKALGKQFRPLAEMGLAVRGHRSCHAKFLVVDDRAALVSSANLEPRAFGITGENGVLIHDRREVGRLARFYSRLWSSCQYEVSGSGSYKVVERAPEEVGFAVPAEDRRRSPRVIWTCHSEAGLEEREILGSIQEVIQRAERELLLSSFSLSGLTENEELLVGPLRDAIGRGVSVRLLVRARNHVAGHRRDAETLARLGVEIRGDALNHAKGVIADRRLGALFSANFDAHHGLTSGVEAGARLDGTRAIEDARQFFERSYARAEMRFAVDPSHRDMSSRLAIRWRSDWPLADTVQIRSDERSWEQLARDLVSGPVLFARSGDGDLTLLAGAGSYSFADAREGADEVTLGQRKAGPLSRELLEQWLSVRMQDPTNRGLCPATLVWRVL